MDSSLQALEQALDSQHRRIQLELVALMNAPALCWSDRLEITEAMRNARWQYNNIRSEEEYFTQGMETEGMPPDPTNTPNKGETE